MAGKQAKILSDQQTSSLLVFAYSTRNPRRNHLIVLLSLKAGLRAGEIAKLTWDMVLGPNGDIGHVIELRDSAAKKNSGRLIPIHPSLRTALAAWRNRTPSAPFVVFAAPGILAAAAKRAGFAAPIIEIDAADAVAAFSNGLPVVPLKNAVEDAPGRPSAANAAATIESIERAVKAVHQGEARAVVTNPRGL